jgi:hypothetical protein
MFSFADRRRRAIVLGAACAMTGLYTIFLLIDPRIAFRPPVVVLTMFFGPYLSALIIVELLPLIGLAVVPPKASALRLGLAITLALMQLLGLHFLLRALMSASAAGFLAVGALLALTGIALGEWFLASWAYKGDER